jgi:hypothetical protein
LGSSKQHVIFPRRNPTGAHFPWGEIGQVHISPREKSAL